MHLDIVFPQRGEHPMNQPKTCLPIISEHDLEKVLATQQSCFILFYAPWCSFSQQFLPVFERCAQDTPQRCYHMEVDDYPHLCQKYSIEVYPTVVYFQNGKVAKRLDGTRGIGLHEHQFRGLIDLCRKQEK